MKATVVIELEDGTVLEGELHSRAGKSGPKIADTTGGSSPHAGTGVRIDYGLPVRPFMKKYGVRLTGPKKLALLVAHMAKGKINSPVRRLDVEKQWGKMNALMGGKYNPAHDTRARDKGWIHSPKRGVFALLAGWEDALK